MDLGARLEGVLPHHHPDDSPVVGAGPRTGSIPGPRTIQIYTNLSGIEYREKNADCTCAISFLWCSIKIGAAILWKKLAAPVCFGLFLNHVSNSITLEA